jgi:hypothetical protein
MIAKRTTEVDNIFYKCFLDFAPVQAFFFFLSSRGESLGMKAVLRSPLLPGYFRRQRILTHACVDNYERVITISAVRIEDNALFILKVNTTH